MSRAGCGGHTVLGIVSFFDALVRVLNDRAHATGGRIPWLCTVGVHTTVWSCVPMSSRRTDSVTFRAGDEASRALYKSATVPHLDAAHKLTQNTVYQAARAAAERLGLESGTARIVDLGCGSSIKPIQTALAALEDYRLDKLSEQRKLGALDVEVFHNDLPTWDWAGVYEIVDNPDTTYNNIPDPEPPGEERDNRAMNVFSASVARSFHKRLLPANSVHVAICCEALQWLSQTASVPSKQAIMTFSQKCCNLEPDVHEAAFQEAKRDWDSFLYARAAEMPSGATLIISVPGTPSAEELQQLSDQYPDQVPPMLLTMVIDRAIDSLVNEGLLDGDDIGNMNLPAFLLTGDELKQILDGVRSLWTPYGFENLAVKTRFAGAGSGRSSSAPVGNWVIHPAYAQFTAGKITAKELGARYSNALRDKAELFAQGLAESRRTKTGSGDANDPEVKALVEKIFERLQDTVEADPVPLALYLFVGHLVRT